MSRHSTLLRATASGFVATLLLSSVSAHAAARSTAPNILLILTDDQGYGDLGVHGNSLVETPNVDRLARDGIQFDRFFVSPVCAPTRASLLTGRWWLRSGVWGVTQSREVMRGGEVTIAETLQAAGYRTGIFGKWHNGEQFPLTPLGQGFDEFLGFTAGHWNHYFDAELTRGSQPEKTKGYITDVITAAAVTFIEQNRARPFFCYVPYNTPHSPYQVPDRYFDKYTAKGCAPELAAIYGMCQNIDDNVGRLLATLDRLGLRENTIVLYLSDNGPVGVRRFNAGMRGTKGTVHEGGTRVPCFLQFPARFRESRIVREIAAHIDLYPTLLDLCGLTRPSSDSKLDGVSLVPLLEGRSAGWPERMLFTQQSDALDPRPEPQPGAVRTSRYRATLENSKSGRAKPEWHLYDMVADPSQTRDLANDQPDVLRSLSAAYTAWWDDVTRDGFADPVLPVGYSRQDPVRLTAPQAKLAGKLHFFSPQGFANTWITGWTESADKISFSLTVGRAGSFAVSLAYGCEPSDAGARIRVSTATASAEATVPAAPAPRIPLPHRAGSADNYVNRAWGTLVLGPLALPAGEQTLTLAALTKPGAQVLDLKHMELRRLTSSP